MSSLPTTSGLTSIDLQCRRQDVLITNFLCATFLGCPYKRNRAACGPHYYREEEETHTHTHKHANTHTHTHIYKKNITSQSTHKDEAHVYESAALCRTGPCTLNSRNTEPELSLEQIQTGSYRGAHLGPYLVAAYPTIP